MTDLLWMQTARSYLGQREIKGAVDNPKIVELFKLSGHGWVQDDETAWCAAFVGGVMALSGIPGTGSLAARSYEGWGQPIPMSSPIYGCVGVKKRSGNAPSWQGHVGFVVGATADQIIMLGGNQGDAVSYASFRRDEFTAFRYPPGVVVPKKPRPLPRSVAGALKAASEA